MSNVDAILYKSIGDRWYTLLGCAGVEYSDSYYQHHAIPSETRDGAIAHALALADQRGILQSRIFEDCEHVREPQPQQPE